MDKGMQADVGITEKDVSSQTSPEIKRSKPLFKKILIIISIIFGMTYLFLFLSGASFNAKTFEATITAVEGNVLMQKEGKGIVIPAEEGMIVASGDIITTALNSSLEVEFADGTISRLGTESRLHFEDLYRNENGAFVISLNLGAGRLWNSVKEITERNSRFEVRTPSSIAGVRGTGFSVEVKENNPEADGDVEETSSAEGSLETVYRVYEGEIGVTGENAPAKEDVSVSAGQQGSIAEGEALPKAEPLVLLDVDEWEKDNLVEDMPVTFVKVETEFKTLLLEINDEKTNNSNEQKNILEDELKNINLQLNSETDNNKREDLEEAITIIQKELELTIELLELLEIEKEELQISKEKFEKLHYYITEKLEEGVDLETLNIMIKEEASSLWQEEKERLLKNREFMENIENIEKMIISFNEKKAELLKTEPSSISVPQNTVTETPASPPAVPREEPEPATPPADLGGVPHSMIIIAQPSSTVAGKSFSKSPAVKVVDKYEKPVSGAKVTVSLNSGKFHSGTLTVTTDNKGMALFNNLVAATAGPNNLFFSCPGISRVMSEKFDVAVGGANGIIIVNQPSSSLTAGSVISPAPSAKVVDAFGNPLAKIKVSVAINKNKFSSGITTYSTAENGTAAFNNLSIEKTDSGYQLTFKAPGLPDAVSKSFSVTPGQVNGSRSGSSCSSPAISAGDNNLFVEVIIKDRYGNSIGGSHHVSVGSGSNNWFNRAVNFDNNGKASFYISIKEPGSYQGVPVNVSGINVGSLNITVN